ncbi:hypothetical protein F4703DRAFT_1826456 [Phycomyces blakesleeanus]
MGVYILGVPCIYSLIQIMYNTLFFIYIHMYVCILFLKITIIKIFGLRSYGVKTKIWSPSPPKKNKK